MKHVDDIRFVATGLPLRHVGRVRAPRTHAGVAPVGRVATTLSDVARRSLSLRLVMQLAAAPVANATAIAFRSAHARAAPAMPSPARRRPFSSVRLTLMQDHSS